VRSVLPLPTQVMGSHSSPLVNSTEPEKHRFLVETYAHLLDVYNSKMNFRALTWAKENQVSVVGE